MQMMVATGLWLAWAAVWFVMARRVKRNAQAELSTSRVVHVAFLVAAFVLILGTPLNLDFFTESFVGAGPMREFIAWVGVALTAAALSFAVAARIYLGKYWSGRITIKEGHELICSGPYAWVRHPIYTGVVGGVGGVALVRANAGGVCAFLLIGVAYVRKIRQEEKILVREFGEKYAAYRRDVKALIPFVL